MIHTYFLLVIGNWKIEKWHLWHAVTVRSPNGKNPRMEWKKVI